MNTSEVEGLATPQGPRVRWGALFAGAISAASVWLLLHVLGLAAGLTSIEPNNPSSLRAAGIGTGIWSVVASLLALFAGGAVTAYIARPADRLGGAMHGAVLWALTTVTGLVLVVSVAGMAMSGAARAGGSVVASLGPRGNLAEPMQALGLNAKDVLAPLNQQLQGQGKPAVSPEQLQAAVKESLQTTMRQGRFDREALIVSLTRNTSLARDDVTDLVTQVEQRSGRLGQDLDNLQTGALQAAESAGKGLWWVFAALLLGLAAAVGGAQLGVSAKRSAAVVRGREHSRQLPLGPPINIPT